MQPGDVLVARMTTPAWTSLFAMASGVVTDVGGPLSHSSIVAREYGIPTVLGTGVATQRLSSGQLITVDGDAGTVTPADAVSTWWCRPQSTKSGPEMHRGTGGGLLEAFAIWVLRPKAHKRDGTDMSTADKTKGKIKETLGSLTGSDDLRKEGQAQQHKGHHLAQAAEARAMAEKDEHEAELFEQEERLRQELLY
jgi:phosphohistidine swiveling domain-containing protein/uncharacterized protein YjbJ (UPF0337 family)